MGLFGNRKNNEIERLKKSNEALRKAYGVLKKECAAKQDRISFLESLCNEKDI